MSRAEQLKWRQDISRPNAVMRAYKKYQLIESMYSDQRHNPNLAPDTYNVRRTAVHNWTDAGEIGQNVVTLAHSNGPTKWVALAESKGAPARELEDLKQEAETIALGRMLEPGEYERLSAWKQRRLQDIMAAMAKRDDGGPGPLQYVPIHYDSIGQPKMAFKESEAGHHVKGVTIAPKSAHSKGAGTLEMPGPDRYNVRGEGFAASGSFYDKKGMSVVMHPAVGPDKVNREVPGVHYDIPGYFGIDPSRQTPFTSARASTIETRQSWEKLADREKRLEFDKKSETWNESVPGPGSYSPKPPTLSRHARMHGREALVKENLRTVGMSFDPSKKTYENDMPGPAAYVPSVRMDGTSAEMGKDAPSFTHGVRLDPSKKSFETPGPVSNHVLVKGLLQLAMSVSCHLSVPVTSQRWQGEGS